MNSKVTCTRVRPNPIFEEWLSILYEDAKKSKSYLEEMLRESLESLMKYPLPLKSGAECIILKGFDRRLCMYLDKLLNDYNSSESESCSATTATGSDNNSISTSPVSSKQDQGSSNCLALDKNLRVELTRLPELSSNQDTEYHDAARNEEVENVQTSNTTPIVSTESTGKGKGKGKGNKGGNKSGKYKPAHRSGSYAILVALLEHSLENPNKPVLTKEELIEKAQKHAEESLLQLAPNSYYNGWSNMSTLQKKGLVKSVKQKKTVYSLTEEGKTVAKEILEDGKHIPTINNIIFKDTPPSTNSTVEKNNIVPKQSQIPSTSGNIDTRNFIELTPDSFNIILLIDKNETGGLRKKNDPTVAQFNKYPDLMHEYRSLKVGDYIWIAKHKVHQDLELVLPFIVERKRMDDLGASIKDGRFHEQKFRLRKCGIKNVIYLVENYGQNTNLGLPINSLMQAIANTRVQEGFKIQMTDSLTHSVRFLAMMTSRLTIRYKARNLRGCNDDPNGEMLMTFEYFNKSSAKSKPLTVTETFIKMLLQLKGMSVDKALAITTKYPTPNSLRVAYAKCDRKEGEILLAVLQYGDYHRKVGPATSKAIYQLFSSNGAV